MQCANHEQERAIGACVHCGKLFCKECIVELDGKYYCKEHLAVAINKMKEEAVSSYIEKEKREEVAAARYTEYGDRDVNKGITITNNLNNSPDHSVRIKKTFGDSFLGLIFTCAMLFGVFLVFVGFSRHEIMILFFGGFVAFVSLLAVLSINRKYH